MLYNAIVQSYFDYCSYGILRIGLNNLDGIRQNSKSCCKSNHWGKHTMLTFDRPVDLLRNL
jgi:hypothetical protein